MSDTTTELRNRHGKAELGSAEEVLVKKLDVFLSSIEHRLARFDQYFKTVDESEYTVETVESEDDESLHSTRRRSSSLGSLRSYSMYNLNKVYEQLSAVKDSVLKNSVLNLEYLYTVLDDKYNYMFSQDEVLESELSEDEAKTEPEPFLSRELLTSKIITNLNYFEQKLAQIDGIIKSKTPQATANYDEDAKFSRFRYFNFNRALRVAQTQYLHYYQLPLSWRENRYIIHGYRFNLSHREMLRSIFHLNHNETGNIWTHIVGVVVMGYLGLVHYPATSVYANNTLTGNVAMYVFLLAALDCLVSSVLWHTYSCFAQLKIRNRFACVDYTGITVLITCSVISAEYCALYHYPKLLATFVGFSVLAGSCGFLFNWSPYFDKPECRPLRIGFYVCLAVLGANTFLVKWYYEGFFTSVSFYLPMVYKSFVWYWIGVVFYGGLIPERWRYDIIINEDDACNHTHSAGEVLLGQTENSGEEEYMDVKNSLSGGKGVSPGHGCSRSAGGLDPNAEESSCSVQDDTKADITRDITQDMGLTEEIMQKHFPDEPTTTPYHRDFLSLWWVDYVLQSHNIWHICVVLGVVGHYFCIVGMFEKVHLGK